VLDVAFRVGPAHGERIVLVHGFTQAGAVWRELADRLAGRFQVLTVDLPGHGGTPAEHDGAGLWEAARLVGEAGARATYVGYSLGGRVLLHLAIAQPRLVRRLVVVGARPGFTDRALAGTRAAADEAMAARIDHLGQARLGEFVDEWLRLPFNARLPETARHRELRVASRAEGLSASLRHCGSGVQEPLWPRLGELSMPVLAVHAEHDLPGAAEDSRRLAACIGANASALRVPGVGHAVPFEAPETFARIVEGFAGGPNGAPAPTPAPSGSPGG
jgi:2-succinyl-6-hydroxy-2,4-cyclohexadiene-1-carboxylate synthase